MYAWDVAYLLISDICVPDEHNGPLILGVSVGRHIFSLRNYYRKNTVSLIFCRNSFLENKSAIYSSKITAMSCGIAVNESL